MGCFLVSKITGVFQCKLEPHGRSEQTVCNNQDCSVCRLSRPHQLPASQGLELKAADLEEWLMAEGGEGMAGERAGANIGAVTVLVVNVKNLKQQNMLPARAAPGGEGRAQARVG